MTKQLLPGSATQPDLHFNVPGDRMSSSMSSRSSDRRRCCGVGGRRPRKAGSRLRTETSASRPGLVTTQKPVSDSICCQRWSFSRRAAVTSARACLKGGGADREARGNLFLVKTVCPLSQLLKLSTILWPESGQSFFLSSGSLRVTRDCRSLRLGSHWTRLAANRC